jgi:hypothetical protein
LQSVIIKEFQAAEAYSRLDLTKAKYNISRLSNVEKENVILQTNPSNFSAFEKELEMTMNVKFSINIHTDPS